jgi:hypothetical protein
MFNPIFIFDGLGLVAVVSGLPLALGMVPMNRWYGFRIPKAYKSEENWFAVNRIGGWWMLIGGILILAAGAYVSDLHLPPPTDSLATVAPPVILGVCLLCAMVQISGID